MFDTITVTLSGPAFSLVLLVAGLITLVSCLSELVELYFESRGANGFVRHIMWFISMVFFTAVTLYGLDLII
jgi:hypothetical protein